MCCRAILEARTPNSVKIVEALLNHDRGQARALANFPTQTKLKQSALIFLVSGSAHRHEGLWNPDVAVGIGELLLDHGANCMYQDSHGWTFLHWALSLDDDGKRRVRTAGDQVHRTVELLTRLLGTYTWCHTSTN